MLKLLSGSCRQINEKGVAVVDVGHDELVNQSLSIRIIEKWKEACNVTEVKKDVLVRDLM